MEQKIYPSVTRILEATKPIEDILALENWRKKVGYEEAERISKNALNRGKMYDSFVEDYYLKNQVALVFGGNNHGNRQLIFRA